MTVGDVNSKERGSGARYNDGKPAYDLVPLWALESCARVFAFGKKKYGSWNWAKGMAWSIPLACILRHLAAIQRGELVDPESGESHTGHIMCNVLMLEHYQKFYPELNDLIEKEYVSKAPEQSTGETEDYPSEEQWRARAQSLGQGPELL